MAVLGVKLHPTNQGCFAYHALACSGVHWTRGEANWDFYKTDMFDDRWWEITRAQLEDVDVCIRILLAAGGLA